MTSGLHNIVAEMRLLYAETSQDGGGGWRAVGERIGISGAYARMIAEGERRLTPEIAARWLGEDDVVVTCRVPVCPTCGGDHGLKGIPDCHGKPVAAVVTLAPGEVVVKQAARKQGKARKPDERGTLHVEKSLIAEINARRKIKGLTQAELVAKALIAYDLLEDA